MRALCALSNFRHMFFPEGLYILLRLPTASYIAVIVLNNHPMQISLPSSDSIGALSSNWILFEEFRESQLLIASEVWLYYSIFSSMEAGYEVVSWRKNRFLDYQIWGCLLAYSQRKFHPNFKSLAMIYIFIQSWFLTSLA